MRNILTRIVGALALLSVLVSPIGIAQTYRPGRVAANSTGNTGSGTTGLKTYSIASSGLTTTYRSSGVGNGGFGSGYTFSSVTYYAGKNIFAIMSTFDGPTAISLNGTSGTKVAEIVTNNGGNKTIQFWEVPKASGGSGSLVLTIATAYSVGYALWSTNASATFVSSQSLAYGYNVDPSQTPSITKPSGGSILVALQSESVSSSIVPDIGTTEVDEFVDPGNFKYWVGERATTGQPSVTGVQFAGSQMLAVSYQ